MFHSVGKLALLLAVAASTTPPTDELQLLQVAVTAKSKQLMGKLTAENGSVEFPDPTSCSSSAAAKDLPNTLFMDDSECSSATKVMPISFAKIADEPIQSASKVMKVEQVPDLAEDASVAASHPQDTITVVLHYLLMLITLVFCMDTLRRLFNEIGEDSEDCEISEAIDSSAALHSAAKDGSVAAVEQLLMGGSRVNALDDWEETPLHHAARAGAIDVCELLLSHGARVNTKNMQGWTPLVAAGSAGKRVVCEWLLCHGATQGDLEESSLPPMLQVLMKVEPEFSPALVESEADLIRRILEPKPEWEQLESLSDWELDDDDEFVPTISE